MRAIVIDAVNKLVREVELDRKDGLRAMQEVVGGYIERATVLENGDDVYVDEEGLLKEKDSFFYIEGASQPLAGNGIVVGHDGGGNTTPCKSTADSIRAKVSFHTIAELQQDPALLAGVDYNDRFGEEA